MPTRDRVWSSLLPCAAALACASPAQEIPTGGTPMRVLWKFEPQDGSIDQIAASGGLVVVACDRGVVVALRADDGSERWRCKSGTDAVTAITVADQAKPGVVVVAGKRVTLCDVQSGEVCWTREVPTELAEPVVVGDVVVAGGSDGTVRALRAKDGELVWTADCLADAPPDPPGFAGDQARFAGRKARPGPAASDGEIAVVPFFDQCRAVAVDVKTGARRAVFATRGWVFMRPVITERGVIVGSQDSACRCFHKATGEVAWQLATGGRIEAACTVRDGRVYQGSCDGSLYCIDLESGRLVWRQPIGSDETDRVPVYEMPFILGASVILPTLSGEIVAFDRASGRVSGRLRPSADSEIDGAAWAGGMLFVQTRKANDHRGEEAVFAIAR